MTRSTQHGRTLVLVCAIAAAPILAPYGAWAGEAAPPVAAGPVATTPGTAPTASEPQNQPANPVPAPQSAPRPPDPTEGDRTALIVQDMAQHPPQAQIPSQDVAHLRTAKMKLGGLLDRSVRGTENSEVGRVIDVMTGEDGKPAALELDVGGFMGVGNRKIAVAWGLFDLSRTDPNDPLRVALSEAQVRSAPAADASGPIAVVTGAAPVAAAKPAPAPAPSAPVAAAPTTDVPPAPKPASEPPAPHPAEHAKDQPGQSGNAPVPATNGVPGNHSSPGGTAGSDGRF